MNACKQCQKPFEVTEVEREFLKKVAPTVGGRQFEIPEPKLCPDCRRQRRYAQRNDRNIYRRTCDKTGKSIISAHHPDKPFPVYAIDVWWSDAYDPKAYGRDFDFSRTFFEQFKELSYTVPRAASIVVASENCDYTIFTLQSRNCFLSSRLAEVEDIYYSYLAFKSRSCFDGYNLMECELCYECVDCGKCYQCMYTTSSKGSFNLMFCSDMSGSNNCFGCVGMVQKQYCFFNQQLSKEEYEKRVKECFDGSHESVLRCQAAFAEHSKKFPVRATQVFNSDNAQGSHIFESKNVINSYDIAGSEDIINCTQTETSKDMMDCDFTYVCELSYELISGGKSMRNLFSFSLVGNNNDVMYSHYCNNGNQNLFGCVGMKNSKYCIFNKQYTKEEYEELVPRIIEHMQKTGEWGEGIPIELSTMSYNESAAQERFPLTKEEVLARGWTWYDAPESTVAQAEGENVVHCEVSGKSFRLIPQELKFYKDMGLPLPTRHPDVRHQDRLNRRTPYQLHETKCRKCGEDMMTDQSENKLIYCQKCYLAETY
ncbi:MAG: hypothetical protein AAB383_04375 [Patescibacteria group bacterium]